MKNSILLMIWLFFSATIFAQSKIFSGIVTDNRSGPLIGATVIYGSTSQSAVTDKNGRFTFHSTADSINVIVSFVGFKTGAYLMRAGQPRTILLKEDTRDLGDVVVVGYTVVKKSNLTGAVSSIKAADLKQTPIVSVDQGLQGRAAGVQVTQNSAAPGGAVSVRIRGGNSITSSNEPLYVIDGFPVSGVGVAATGGTSAGNSAGNISSGLTGINPNDIASIEVLKDAASTAIYGSRGANGVVLITTKRGKKGMTKVDFEAYFGIQKITKTLSLLNATDFAKMENLLSPGLYPSPEALEKGTDWQKEIFREAPIQNYQLSVSGGNDKTIFNLSANYFNQDGIIINSNYKRAAFRFNFEHKLSSRIKIGTSTILSRGINNAAVTSDPTGASVLSSALNAPPTIPVYAPDGSYRLFGDYNVRYVSLNNPVAFANEVLNKYTSNRILSTVYADVNITKDLTYRASFGGDFFIDMRDSYIPRTVFSGQGPGGLGGRGNLDNTTLLHESILNYNKTFNDIHNFALTAVYSTQSQISVSSAITTQGFPSDVLINNNLALGNAPTVGTSKTRWRLDSYTARANYTFKDKYLLSLVSRVDGSTRFGKNNKYGFFPSIAGAWKISAEPFMENQTLVSNLKLRASYGVTGNADIPLYQSLARLGTGAFNYNFNNARTIGIGPLGIANPTLKWENAASYNAGLDISLFKERLNFTMDAYVKETNDLLIARAISPSSGFSSYFGNFGAIQNKGLEFTVNANPVDGAVKWNIAANIAFNRNKLVRIDGKRREIIPISNGGSTVAAFANASILRVGAPVGSFYGYVFDGIYQNAAEIAAGINKSARPGSARFKDVNGDGNFSDADRTIIGNPNPNFTYGLNSNVSCKGFDFSVFIQGTQGNNIFNLSRLTLESSGGGTNNLAVVNDRWTPTNPGNKYIGAFSAQRILQSTAQVEDGSYLRLKNVTLGYNFPAGKIQWASKLRVYASANNLLTFTKYSGYDPEVNTTGQLDATNFGIDNNGYPVARSFLIGIQLGL